MDIQKVLREHKKWLADDPDGIQADLYGADLSGVYLSYADLRCADLRETDLSGADLSHADLSYADLHGADLRGADLRGANLIGACLSGADLHNADLSGANLSGAYLIGANLIGANLSGAKNLIDPARWLAENFESDNLGYIVYKAITNTPHKPPEHWRIEPGAFLEETPNLLPTVACGCGVNFGTLDWVRNNRRSSTIWRCRIRWADLPSVVVPYNTDGRARCGRLELLEVVA